MYLKNLRNKLKILIINTLIDCDKHIFNLTVLLRSDFYSRINIEIYNLFYKLLGEWVK